MIARDKLRFLYFGNDTEWFKKTREKYNLTNVVICPGKVSRKESIKALFKASIIYLRIVEDMISTKLFEGLCTGNPILSATSNQEVIDESVGL